MLEDSLYKKFYNKWYNDFIYELDLSNIRWIKLTAEELIRFYNENYYDEDAGCFALSTNMNNMIVSPFGLELTSYNSDRVSLEYTHLLGIVPNRKGTYTIVSKIKMDERYKYITEVDECIYVEYIEVNSFFKKRGIFKLTIQSLINFIDLNKNIVLTDETEEGKKCRVHELFRKILNINNYSSVIKTEDDVDKEICQSILKRLKK